MSLALALTLFHEIRASAFKALEAQLVVRQDEMAYCRLTKANSTILQSSSALPNVHCNGRRNIVIIYDEIIKMLMKYLLLTYIRT